MVTPNTIAHYQQESLMWDMTRTQICYVSTAHARWNEEDTLLCLIVGVDLGRVRKRNFALIPAILIRDVRALTGVTCQRHFEML